MFFHSDFASIARAAVTRAAAHSRDNPRENLREGDARDDEEEIVRRLASDPRFKEAAHRERSRLVAKIEGDLGPFEARQLQALLEAPRERFVRLQDLPRSYEDVPLPLDDEGLSTISAPHAYLLSFRVLDLREGDALIELGTGSGYGAALASDIVGDEGSVRTFEIDERLASRATRLLLERSNVQVFHLDATESAPVWGSFTKVVATFAVDPVPDAWLHALPIGGVLVTPIGPRDRDQRLVRIIRTESEFLTSDHGGVRYVSNRSTIPPARE
ncbi:protein-L-isoaspartate O-methyltransferase [Pendulispora albinea]|uniref:Protein-L-isoaspartate O-methyltransferase n=1 Tax=Pendulispora albinea TaxID=2741071 RepID=A0ABZ2M1Z4_9BACT